MTNWDERYRAQSQQSEAEATPSELVVEYVAGLPAGNALDLACGTGRNALWLAEQGWSVTAVDSSAVAIEILRGRAAARKLAIQTHIADLEKHEFQIRSARWDLIVIWNYLQRDLFSLALSSLSLGGLLIASALLGDSRTQRFRAAPGELRHWFAREKIITYREVHNERAEIVVQKR